MADEKHFNLPNFDVNQWNKWREENPVQEINLQGIDLSRVNLTKANLEGANLTQAILTKANLEGAIVPKDNSKTGKIPAPIIVAFFAVSSWLIAVGLIVITLFFS